MGVVCAAGDGADDEVWLDLGEQAFECVAGRFAFVVGDLFVGVGEGAGVRDVDVQVGVVEGADDGGCGEDGLCFSLVRRRWVGSLMVTYAYY